jgi:antitoxin component of MazEF toxin-antitoxin module
MPVGRPSIPEIRFTRVSKNGTSEAVIIPKELLRQVGLHRGSTLEVWIDTRGEPGAERHVLVLAPARSARELWDDGAGLVKGAN